MFSFSVAVALVRHPVYTKLLLYSFVAIDLASFCCCYCEAGGVDGCRDWSLSLSKLGVDKFIGSVVGCNELNLLLMAIDGDMNDRSGVFSFMLLVSCVSGTICVSGIIVGSFSVEVFEEVLFSENCFSWSFVALF